ncbi:hypothetical protein [Vallitalea okinawensis]|nr:hypothetical protein [Vallitalea okinawensis]
MAKKDLPQGVKDLTVQLVQFIERADQYKGQLNQKSEKVDKNNRRIIE